MKQKFKNIFLLKIILLSLTLFSFSSFAKENFINYNFYADFLQVENNDRYNYLENLIEEKETHLVKITEGGSSFYMPIHSFLVIQGHEKEAITLVENKIVSPFEIFEFNKVSDVSDMVLAIDLNRVDYIRAVSDKIDNINERFLYNNERGSTLLMVAANNTRSDSYLITKILLRNGADQSAVSYNNLTAIKIAQSKRNNVFLNALNDHNESIIEGGGDLLKNSSISGRVRLEENRILENLKSGMMEEIINSEEPHEDIFKLIINGYSKSAGKLIEEMEKRDILNPNYINDDGFSLLMATSLSRITGGDVENAVRLIEFGADVNYRTPDRNTEGEVALIRDSFKVLFALIVNGFDPFSKESSSDGVDLLSLTVETNPISINSLNLLTMIYEDIYEDYN